MSRSQNWRLSCDKKKRLKAEEEKASNLHTLTNVIPPQFVALKLLIKYVNMYQQSE